MDVRSAGGAGSTLGSHDGRLSSENGRRRNDRSSENRTVTLEDSPDSQSDSLNIDEQIIGEFTRAEVVDTAVTAATMIDKENLVRTSTVKTTVWELVDLSERSRNDFWEVARDVLIAMDGIHGRAGGHIWASSGLE